MQYTEQQKMQFREQFAARRKRQLIATIPAVAVMLAIALLGEDADPPVSGVSMSIIIGVALVAVISLLIFSLRNWRYPACDGYIGRVLNPKICSKCGAELR